MKKFASNAATLLIAALGQVHGQPAGDISFDERMRKDAGPMGPATFAFVPGHYYTSTHTSRVITEYDGTGAVVGSYTVPSAQGEEVRGLAFGADGLLYATISRGSSGFAVLALESDGTVVASYEGPVYIAGGGSYGKIAMDNQYLYLCGQSVLTRFRLGDPSSGTTIYAENQIYVAKPLPNGHLFVASAYYVDEITTSGTFVRRIPLTGGQFFADIRGLEYNPATNILFGATRGQSTFLDCSGARSFVEWFIAMAVPKAQHFDDSICFS